MTQIVKKRGRRNFLRLLIFSSVGTSLFAQKRSSKNRQFSYDPKIPKAEIPHLKKRLELYLHYQVTEQWDKLPELLGGKMNEHYDRTRFTAQEMTGLVEAIKRRPITLFDWQKTIFSTEILSVPRHKRWWYIEGTAPLTIGTETKIYWVSIEAYKINGEWFFTPRVPNPYEKET